MLTARVTLSEVNSGAYTVDVAVPAKDPVYAECVYEGDAIELAAEVAETMYNSFSKFGWRPTLEIAPGFNDTFQGSFGLTSKDHKTPVGHGIRTPVMELQIAQQLIVGAIRRSAYEAIESEVKSSSDGAVPDYESVMFKDDEFIGKWLDETLRLIGRIMNRGDKGMSQFYGKDSAPEMDGPSRDDYMGRDTDE